MKLLILITAAYLAAMPVSSFAQSYSPTGPIERKYSADGPWSVSTTTTSVACDQEGNPCDIFFPTMLGANPLKGMQGGFRHPVIVFANGTAVAAVTADKNSYYLRHLASWGFVVIRSRDGNTGSGNTVVDVANYVSGLDRDPSSVFHNKLDTANMGLTGHSQGAATATLLFSRSNAFFKTYVPIETPEQAACVLLNLNCSLDPGSLSIVSSGSIFFIGGNLDPISPITTNLAYYNSTSNNVDKVMGMIALGSHNEIEGSPACTPGLCTVGVYPLLGFPTAWFMWKLQSASDGPDAFRKGTGELARAVPNWIGSASNIK